jgi:ABC-type lipoprotein export system ATPase subunit
MRPALILADEPTGNLDSKASGEILGLLSELNTNERHTIVMVTHDPGAASIAGRVVFLRDGLIAGEVSGGSTQKVTDFLSGLEA